VHGEALRQVLDSLPLEPRHEQLIGLSALATVSFLIDAWLAVVVGHSAPIAASAHPQ